MSNSNILEIVQGLAQAAAYASDGAHDKRFSHDGEERKVGLRREEGCAIIDSRVIDGFGIKFYGDCLVINYQSDVRMKELKDNGFENEIARTLNDIKKFLEKEYKVITGNSISLTAKGEAQILVQTTSNIRTLVQAYQHYKIGGLEMDQILAPSTERDVTKKFLEATKAPRPKNEMISAKDNEK